MTSVHFSDLAGKWALITGSTRGIGAALADALELAGANVLRHGLADDTRATRDGALHADLSTTAGVEDLAKSVRSRTDRLDILVNNAGLEAPSRLERLSDAALHQTLAVNLAAPILLTRSLLPLLQRGAAPSVVNVTSIHDEVPYAGNVAYVASKAGVEGASRTLALELAGAGIRVNVIAPGAIETEMNRDILDEMGREQFGQWIPLGRVGTVDDLTAAMLFLASDASRYLTGARLVIDGGYSLSTLRYGLD